MPKIYLINVGANLAHRSLARSPIYSNGNFKYVSFPDDEGRQSYPKDVSRYRSPNCPGLTHLDPDWLNLTYGDNCANPRACALLNAEPSDILLFWGLLWRNSGDGWSGWTGERGWYLIGALRIEEILEAGDPVSKAKAANRDRARLNAHVSHGHVVSKPKRVDRLFIGFTRFSALFEKAVDFGIGRTDSLFQRTIYTAGGQAINWRTPPRWNSVVRSCRAVWDLNDPAGRRRVRTVREAIRRKNPQFDLLAGL
ncbi:MAG: hypothetical protein HY735_05055 [Verrucomicrobia bacterium]|nr:hypothetical protein [Verrucomicrobiota bacterium]